MITTKILVTVVVFFGTVVMWMLPGVAGLFTDAAWVKTLNGFGITFVNRLMGAPTAVS